MAERLFVRILVATVLCIALLSFVLVPVPTDLPPPAFDQTSLYRLEIALMFFYGTLLLVTPAFSGLKFVEEADQSAARDAAAIRELEETARDLEQRLTETDLEIRRLGESLEETVSNRR